MRSDLAVGGLGSGVGLIWIWNRVLPWLFGLEPEAWPEMPAEVAAIVATSMLAWFENLFGDRS